LLRAKTLEEVFAGGFRIIESTSFYGMDGHGSVRFLTDNTGRITDAYDYDAFGSLIASAGSTQNNYLFAGEQFDPLLGVYYNRARYYDQRQGRFWTQDTFEGNKTDPASLHRYIFTNNDPVSRIDPSGNDSLAEISASEEIGEELDAASVEEEFAVKKVISLKIIDIYSCSKVQAYIIPIHCWVYANQPGNIGPRYDIGADDGQRSPGLILGSVSGYLRIRNTTLDEVREDANLSFNKETSLSELGFVEWNALIVAEFEFLGAVDNILRYKTNYSFNTLTNDAVNCLTFTGFAIAAAKRIGATGP
jgi:RHS repeat-associated protein